MKRERLTKNEHGDFVWVPIEKAVNHDERKIYSTRYCVPERSVAAGCNSTQVKDFNEYYKTHGITGAYHEADGTLVIEDNNSRNEVMKLRGLYDRNAGYSEFAGNASDE